MLESLEKMLAQGIDNPMLRFGLGKGYLDAEQPAKAVKHLRRCVEMNPRYSAAWKLLGKAMQAAGDSAGARPCLGAGHRSRRRSRATSRPNGNGGVPQAPRALTPT